MKTEISSTEAARSFGDCLARVKHKGETFVILKNNKPVAELSPPSSRPGGTWKDFVEAWGSHPDDPTFADDLERANSKEIEPDPWNS